MNKDDTHHGQQQEQGQEEQTFFATWLPRNDMREIAVLMELPIEGLSYARLVAEIRTGCPGPRGAFGILCYRAPSGVTCSITTDEDLNRVLAFHRRKGTGLDSIIFTSDGEPNATSGQLDSAEIDSDERPAAPFVTARHPRRRKDPVPTPVVEVQQKKFKPLVGQQQEEGINGVSTQVGTSLNDQAHEPPTTVLSAPKSAATLKLEEAVGQLTTVFAQALLASTKAAYSRRPES